jgi:hypothetical protein
MNWNEKAKAVADLQTEIAEMQGTILYLENRIVRKQIAIAEIVTGMDCPDIPEERTIDEVGRLSMTTMCREAVGQFNGAAFSHRDIKNKMLELFPGRYSTYSRQTFYAAINTLKEEGALLEAEGGFKRP